MNLYTCFGHPVELDMAIAYWNIVLRGRFKFLDLWCSFLQVTTTMHVWVEIIRHT